MPSPFDGTDAEIDTAHGIPWWRTDPPNLVGSAVTYSFVVRGVEREALAISDPGERVNAR